MAAKEPKKTGLKPPSRIGKSATGIAKPETTDKSSSSLASSRAQSPDGCKKVDDYIIGDHVYVGGTKSGVIAYLGATKFAGGDWAGIILDEFEGKNDGMVQGVRYFQCEPKKGVFAKPSKLTRHKVNSVDAALGSAVETKPAVASAPKSSKYESPREPTSTRVGLPKKNGSISASNTSLSSAAMASVGAKHIKLGERVVVNGTKVGTLRFLGTTDFAPGEWAGVELSEATGKNDGSVGGKRYFECKPLYGLFAPVHKVTKESVAQSMSPTMGGRATPLSHQRPSSHRLCSTPSMSSMLNSKCKDLSVSQDSLNSIGSAISTASRSRVRLGVTSLQGAKSANQTAANRVAQARQAYKGVSTAAAASTAALQKALKEKDEHIEQLMRERELERSEVFKASVQKEEESKRAFELEEELNRVNTEFKAVAMDADFRVNEMDLKIEQLQEENKELQSSLSEQKLKLEDLQFQMEEEAISRGEQEADSLGQSDTISQLKKQLLSEEQLNHSLQEQMSNLQMVFEKTSTALIDSQKEGKSVAEEVAKLRDSLSHAGDKLTSQQMGNATAANKNDELERVVLEKESLLQALKEKSSQLENRVKELSGELDNSKQSLTLLEENIESSQSESETLAAKNRELTARLDAVVLEQTTLNTDLGDTRLGLSDVQRALETSEAVKAHVLSEKERLQQHIDELMRNSGDSSQQLSMLNDELREKNRKLEALQHSFSQATNDVGKLQELLNLANKDHTLELSALNSQHEKAASDMQSNIDDLTNKLTSSNRIHTDQVASLNGEISLLKDQLEEHSSALNERVDEKKLLQSVKDEQEKTISSLSSKSHDLEVQLKDRALLLETTAAQCSELEKQIVSLRGEKEKGEREFTHLQTQREETRLMCDKLSIQLSESCHELETVNHEKSAADTELSDLKLHVSGLVVDLQRAIDTATENRATILTEKIKLEQKVEDVMKNSGDNSQQLTLLNGELKAKNRKVESLQKSLSEAANNSKKLQELLDRTNEDHKAELSSLNTEREKKTHELRVEIEKLTASRATREGTYTEKVDDLREELMAATNKYQDVKSQFESEQQKSQQLDGKLNESITKLDDLSNQNDELERVVLEKESLLQALKEKSSQLENRVKELSGELDNSKQSLTLLQCQLTDNESNTQKLAMENSELKGELDASQQEKIALNKELKDINLEKADVQRALESAESFKDRLGEEKIKLEQQVDSMLKSSGQSLQQQTALHEELKDKETKLESLHEMLSEATNNGGKLQELLDKANEEHAVKLSTLNSHLEKTTIEFQLKVSNLEAAKLSIEKISAAKAEELCKDVARSKQAMEELTGSTQAEIKEKEDLLATRAETIRKLEEQIREQQVATKNFQDDLENSQMLVSKLEANKESLISQLTSEKDDVASQRQTEVASLKSEFEQQGQERELKISQLQKQLKAQQELFDHTKSELESRLEQAKGSADEAIFQMEEQLIAAKSEVDSLQAQVDKGLEERSALTGQLEATTAELRQSQKALTENQQEIQQLRLSLGSADEIKEQLQTRIFSLEEAALTSEEELKSTRAMRESLTKKLKSIDEKIAKTSKKTDLEMATLTAELESKQQQVEIQTSLIEKYEIEIKHLKSQVNASSTDTEHIQNLRRQLSKLEDERDEFKREAEDLTFKMEELSLSAGGGNTGESRAASDRYQIEFLNSVIVDQKTKIDELNQKIKVLAEVADSGENGFEFDFSTEFSEETRKPPPRLFCDICDIFDAHDTDDCPVQAQDDDEPAPSYHHVERGNSRPYCDTCEVFGHSTEDCDEPDEW